MNDCYDYGDYNFFDFNIRRPDDVRQPAECELVVGDQYHMRVDGPKVVRVLLITPPALDEHDELRAHVVVLENNPYLRSGAECRPLAFTLKPLSR